MNGFGIAREQRLRRSQDFRRVYDLKQRAGDDHLLVFAAKNDVGVTRFGLSVSRKLGGAVKRARLKRLLREAFRLSQHDLPASLDLVLIPRADRDSQVEDYRASLESLTRRLAKKLDRETRP